MFKTSACQKFLPMVMVYALASKGDTMQISTRANQVDSKTNAMMRNSVLDHSSLKTHTSWIDRNSSMGKCLMKCTVCMRSIPATSCPWLLTWQQCGSFVGERLLVEGLFTAATNQRSSKFLNVTQRLHQTTRTADGSHGDPWLLPDMRDKGLVQTPPPFWGPSQDPMLFLSSTFTELLIHSGMSHLFTTEDPSPFLLEPLSCLEDVFIYQVNCFQSFLHLG